MVSPLPKLRSKAFKTALAELKRIFDAQAMGVVVLDALDRRVCEQIFQRFGSAPAGGRVRNLKKSELVTSIVAGFFRSDEIAFQVAKELDRACHKERYLVESVPEDQASDRIGSYRALALKRERAKFVWALARDERSVVRGLANRIIAEFFAEAADLQTTRAVLEGAEDDSRLDRVALAKRLREQVERLGEASRRMSDLESRISQYEDERARLVAQIGAKERSLRQETEARSEVETQLRELRQTLSTLESEQAAVEAAEVDKKRAEARADDLAHKVRRLSKLAGASDRLGEVQSELEQAKRQAETFQKDLARAQAELLAARAEFANRLAKVEAAHENTRAELKRTRAQLQEVQARPAAGEDPDEAPAGLAILLDQANVAAGAVSRFSRKVDFHSLLQSLAAGRKVSRAIAFVVDNGGAQFDAFCATLRKAGWELRLKRPKTFSDGRSKADWDMGIAVEAVELRGKVECIVLASGDGDFAPLARLLRRWGVRVEVAAYPESLARELVDAADAVIHLDARTLE